MTFENWIQIITLFLATFTTVLSLWLRYKLIEMGKDVTNLKAQIAQKLNVPPTSQN